MAKLTRAQLEEKIRQGKIDRGQDILLYEEIQNLKDEVEAKLKLIEKMLKSDKIFKDLFYSARGITSSGDNIFQDLIDYLKKDKKFVEDITGKDAVVDYSAILKEVMANIRQPEDGQTPVIDYKKIIKDVLAKIPSPEPPIEPDISQIVAQSVKQTTEELKPLIPEIKDIEKELPQLGAEIRDGLELLTDHERLDKTAIKGLDDYEEVAKLAKNPKVVGVGGGSTARNFYQLGDVPQSYSGQANRVVSVKADASGLEFTTPGAASMVYPNIGVAVSTGSAWGTSIAQNTIFLTDQTSAQTITASPVLNWLTASKVVFTTAGKFLTSTGIGTSGQFIKGDGSLATGVLANNKPAVANQFLTAYDSGTGNFTQAQPVQANITGLTTADTPVFAGLKDSALTATRIVFTKISGELTDDAALDYSSGILANAGNGTRNITANSLNGVALFDIISGSIVGTDYVAIRLSTPTQNPGASITLFNANGTVANELRIGQLMNAPMTFYTNNTERLRILSTGVINIPNLTASKVVFTDASKNLTSTGIGTSSQFIKGDGSLDSTTYLTSATLYYQTIQDQGSGLTQRAILNFTGTGIAAADDTYNLRTNVTLHANLTSLAMLSYSSSSFVKMTGANTFTLDTATYLTSAYYQTVQNQGSGLTQRAILNFTGNGIQAADDTYNTRTNVTLAQDIQTTASPTFTNLTLTNLTPGYVLFSNGSDVLTQDTTANRMLFWDATNHRLGIGTASPALPLDVLGYSNGAHGMGVGNAARFQYTRLSDHQQSTFVMYSIDDTTAVNHTWDFRAALYYSVSTGGNTSDALVGADIRNVLNGNGVITNSTGLQIYPVYELGYSSSGTFTKAYGILIGTQPTSAGTVNVGTYYGMFLEDPVKASIVVTNCWGIYANGTNMKHYLGGSVIVPQVYNDIVGATNRDVYVDNTGVLGYVSSSIRYKENIRNIENASWIYKLRPVSFDYKDKSKGTEVMGLIAEEVEKINPKIISYERIETSRIKSSKEKEPDIITYAEDKSKPETVNYSQLIIPMLREIQNLKTEIEKLKSKI